MRRRSHYDLKLPNILYKDTVVIGKRLSILASEPISPYLELRASSYEYFVVPWSWYFALVVFEISSDVKASISAGLGDVSHMMYCTAEEKKQMSKDFDLMLGRIRSGSLSYDKFLKRLCDTLDSYALGVALSMFIAAINSKTRLMHVQFYTALRALTYNMYHPDIVQRICIKDASKLYDSLLAKYSAEGKVWL
jgi:hypothetical protein